MQKTILMLAFFWFIFISPVDAQLPKVQVKVVACVESLMPNGVGRSRMFETDLEVNYLEFTSKQTDDKGNRNKSNRKDVRIKDYQETKLLNLYNEGGIRFQNLATNDALMMSKINDMLAQGWELFYVGAGVESKMINVSVKKALLTAGLKALMDDNSKEEENKNDPNGLFMTRYYFMKKL